METIKVNMTPCDEVQTIHASQDDNEAREWGFALHNNGDAIGSSSISDQLVFKAYEGGTEEILPTNGSTPTTSPFLGDIKYPQGLLSDQEFLYRESPTEEDGYAKITDIKGNSIAFNQLVQNGNFTSTSGWASATPSQLSIVGASNNRLLFTCKHTEAAIINNGVSFPSNRKLLIKLTTDLSNVLKVRIYSRSWVTLLPPTNLIRENDFQYLVINPLSDAGRIMYIIPFVYDNVQHYISNVQVFDLTMLGIDNLTNNEVIELFRDYFPLSYYDYNQGTLLSFNGNGIKTVGKNQFNYDDLEVGTIDPNNGNNITNNDQRRTADYIHAIDNKQYTVSNINGRIRLFEYDANKAFITSFLINNNETFTLASNCAYFRLGGTEAYYSENTQIESGSTVTSYEPYTSSTLSLPISTYFPTGMKSAYNSSSLTDIVRDELLQKKAIKKVKQITYDGSSDENWSIENINSGSASGQHNFYTNVAPAKKLSSVMNNMAVPYALYTQNYIDGKISSYVSNGQNLNFYPGTDITSVADFRTWLGNHPLTVNIALPTDSYEETPITTASLVTENAEIPLSNDDGVLIGKCTEQLSSESGFFDAKIKLADTDGDVYSNKIQLHVERKPS